ncbi:MAG: hypothetical protein RIF41_35690 [Polyangiaceae bacterium]
MGDMVAKILSRLLVPALILTAGCQVATSDEPGMSESFSTDGPPAVNDAPAVDDEPTSIEVDAFALQCAGIADEVAYCESELPLWDPEADVATACAPADSAMALACCNAFDAGHCAAVCEAGDVAAAGDLGELVDYLGSGVAAATSRVAAVCGGADLDIISEEAASSSELLSTYGLSSWGDPQARPVEEIGALFLTGFDEAHRMLDELGHDDELVAWSFDQHVGTEDGEYFLTKWVFYYPETGVVVVLEGVVGFV